MFKIILGIVWGVLGFIGNGYYNTYKDHHNMKRNFFTRIFDMLLLIFFGGFTLLCVLVEGYPVYGWRFW